MTQKQRDKIISLADHMARVNIRYGGSKTETEAKRALRDHDKAMQKLVTYLYSIPSGE